MQSAGYTDRKNFHQWQTPLLAEHDVIATQQVYMHHLQPNVVKEPELRTILSDSS